MFHFLITSVHIMCIDHISLPTSWPDFEPTLVRTFYTLWTWVCSNISAVYYKNGLTQIRIFFLVTPILPLPSTPKPHQKYKKTIRHMRSSWCIIIQNTVDGNKLLFINVIFHKCYIKQYRGGFESGTIFIIKKYNHKHAEMGQLFETFTRAETPYLYIQNYRLPQVWVFYRGFPPPSINTE